VASEGRAVTGLLRALELGKSAQARGHDLHNAINSVSAVMRWDTEPRAADGAPSADVARGRDAAAAADAQRLGGRGAGVVGVEPLADRLAALTLVGGSSPKKMREAVRAGVQPAGRTGRGHQG
jgi:hypothetical protein